MISKTSLESITDRIGQQVYNIRDTFGITVNETPVTSLTVCDSLYECNDDVQTSGDKQSLSKLIGYFDYLQGVCDYDNILKTIYNSRILAINSFLIDGDEIAYSGYSKFSIDEGIRYSSEFCRLITLSNLTLASALFCYYDQADVLGGYVVSGSGTGTWTPANNPFDSITVSDVYGVQPSCGLEVIATSAIVADTTINVNADTVDGGTVNLTASLSNADPLGTLATLTSATSYDNYLIGVNSVSISGGNATDTFNIRFKPLRTISL